MLSVISASRNAGGPQGSQFQLPHPWPQPHAPLPSVSVGLHHTTGHLLCDPTATPIVTGSGECADSFPGMGLLEEQSPGRLLTLTHLMAIPGLLGNVWHSSPWGCRWSFIIICSVKWELLTSLSSDATKYIQGFIFLTSRTQSFISFQAILSRQHCVSTPSTGDTRAPGRRYQ